MSALHAIHTLTYSVATLILWVGVGAMTMAGKVPSGPISWPLWLALTFQGISAICLFTEAVFRALAGS